MSTTPSKTTSKTTESIFTPRELELLGKALQANKNEVQLDYAKFADLGGFKNANSAKASWHGLKKKLERLHESTADGGESKDTGTADETGEEASKKTPASGKKRKAADKGEEAPKTPASNKKRKSAATVDGEEDEETTPAKSAKKPGRKPRAKKATATATAAADEEEEKPGVKKESNGEGEEAAAEKSSDDDKDATNENGDAEKGTDGDKGEADKDAKNDEAVKEEADDA